MTDTSPDTPSDPVGELTPHRREVLAVKGRRLYGKYCGSSGRGICAESFACYHLDRGQPLVAADLLAWLRERLNALELADPDDRRAMTEGLVGRIEAHLRNATEPRLP